MAFNKIFFGSMGGLANICDPAKMLEMHEKGTPDAEVFEETHK